MQTTDNIEKKLVNDTLIRVMSPEQITEREALNLANTTSALRARVVNELVKTNGHSTVPTST